MIARSVGDGWIVDVDPAWPGFAGHFPGDPILPAAELIGFARAVTGDGATGIAKARFLAPVRPGDRLAIAASRGRSGTTVVIRCGSATVAEILLR